MNSNRFQYVFIALCLLGALLTWRALLTTFSLAWRDEQYTHILLIIPFALAMAWLQWKKGPGPRSQFHAWRFIVLGLAGVLAAATLWAISAEAADVKLALSMIALVLWWIGAFISCFGTEFAYSLLFPLCFLLWLIPFPQSVLYGLIHALQVGSAISARLLFEAVGTPVMQQGVRLMIPGLTLEVATECSSIRSSMILIVTTMVVGQIVLRSPWRKLLLVFVAIPICVAKNGLRIFTIAMLGTHVDSAYLTGRLHRQGGPVFLAIALAAIFVFLWILRRGERPADSTSTEFVTREARA